MNTNLQRLKTFALLTACCHGVLPARAEKLALQQPTATYSQGEYSVEKAIDGTTADDRGWAVLGFQGGSPIAVFETVADAGFPNGSIITFTLTQTHSNLGHTLGRFRFSVTTDNRSGFADGLLNGGDVTANWTVLHPRTVRSLNGATLTGLGDDSILAGGADPYTDVYTVTAATSLVGITGIRLETLTDPSLPNRGPGRYPLNGNFVLSEFGAEILPRFTPKLAVSVSRVNVAMQVEPGKKYQLEFSTNLAAWAPAGAPFVAQEEFVNQEFVVADTGRYFRFSEVP